ncbi:Transposase DDE domain-containing protein [Nonomuraea jiangxiensis]|uniref:Transposase DDE domain-containing protein n=1 Tax=Nonomuraea jiangxiensis TaxID=633440 RepID=A0A1G7ZAY2_9ACTN|nr:Transposase DDE domain-containing protein [Nonomuraea jiangxiensis]
MESKSVINRTLVVASGPFAPGHLGELTQLMPFEMVDEALKQTGRVQQRVRDLPSRVAVYLMVAGALFPELGWRQVWQRLTAGLTGLTVAAPTGAAMAQARKRIAAAPLRWLFELLRGPSAGTATPGTHWHGLLVCAIDGTVMSVADSPANLAVYPKQRGNHGGAGYPALRLLTLLACGTRTLLDAVFAPASTGETTLAPRLLERLHRDMIVLLDRNFAVCALIQAIAATGAHVLVRVKNGRRLPLLARCHDGSYLSRLGATPVRVIDAVITITTRAGHRTSAYRLVTTLTDAHRHPAADLLTLYHQRWEIETAYLEIKSTILGGRVLRARTPDGLDQEVHALLVAYQLLRLAMAEATTHRPGLDPDRASFTIALNTARDLVIQAAGVIADTVIDLLGTIGRQVLANLMPDRRIRTRPRLVKRAISKHNARGTVDRTSYKATIGIEIRTSSEP